MAQYSKGSLYAADPFSTMVLYILQEGFCNARCNHCYMLLQNQSPKKRELETAKQDLEYLTSEGYNVHLRGTEILLNPEYLKLFSLVKQDYIQTNGKELYKNPSLFQDLHNEEIKKILLTYPSEPKNLVDFSKEMIDHVINESSNMRFRTIVDFICTKGTFEAFREDSSYFEKLSEHLIRMNTHELRFVRLIPFNLELGKITLSSEESRRIIEESVRLESQYKGELGITRAGQFGCFDLRRELKEQYFGIKVPLPEESGIMDCPAGTKLFVIDLNNNVYPCLYLMNDSNKIGKFTKGKIIVKPETKFGALHLDDCPAYMYHSES